MKKRIYIEHGDLIINVNKQCFFTISTEWGQLLGKHNWYTITPIHIFLENDLMCKGYLFKVTLLGFSVSFRYNTKEALELFKKWRKESKETTTELVKGKFVTKKKKVVKKTKAK